MIKNLGFILFLFSFFVIGCVSPFSQFYHDETGGLDITSSPFFEIANEEPKILRGNWGEFEKDNITMIENGYKRVGYSSFNAGNVKEYQVITQAKKVHASAVILYSNYTNTVSGSVPITTPDTQTSTTNLSGNIYGSGGGYASYSGTGTTTTYGSRTTYIPYNVRRYDYGATYWVKMKSDAIKFGVHVNELTPEIRQQIGSNKGLLIIAVIKNTPAFYADILNGDVIRKVGTIEIFNEKIMKAAIVEYAGEEVQIEIWRNGNNIKKNIKFNP